MTIEHFESWLLSETDFKQYAEHVFARGWDDWREIVIVRAGHVNFLYDTKYRDDGSLYNKRKDFTHWNFITAYRTNTLFEQEF